MKRAALVGVLVVVAVACEDASLPPDLETARDFDGYPLYYAGEDVAGLPLTHADVLASQASFVYGECDPGVGMDPGGCAPPVEVQVWARRPVARGPNACDEIRGVPAAVYDDRIELFTGEVTVVVFGHARNLVALALRGLNTDAAADEDLPRPTPNRALPRACRPRR